MKTIRILITLIIALGIAYFFLDRNLYFYGKNLLYSENRLPLNIVPESRPDFEGGFLLRDEYGFSLISKGEVEYVGTKFKFTVSDIIKYGFNDKELVALIQEENSEKYVIRITKNTNKQSKQDLIVNIIEGKTFNEIDKYKWIELKDNQLIKRIELVHNYLFLLIIVLIITSIILLTKRKSTNANTR